jgi:serine protease AprX
VKLNFRRAFGVLLTMAVGGALYFGVQAASLSPTLQSRLEGVADGESVGMVIVAFKTNGGLTESHLNVLRSVGVTGGQTFPTLGIVAQPMTAGQVRALAADPAVASVWSNDPVYYYMDSARTMAGVGKVETDAPFTFRNGGLPVAGSGDFSVLVIDSGIDATHADLQLGQNVVQNVQTVVGAGTLPGFTPNVSIENVPNTDQTVGHGSHCAGIVGATGLRSGGLYAGVAPGAKIIGAGLGAGTPLQSFVLNAIAAWEWGLANQYRYKIRVVSNSYGSPGPYDPNNPIVRAARLAYERNITVVFAGANSGPGKGTWNLYAKAPFVIGVAAGTKEGTLADFSSRGTPREERLGNSDPLDDFDAPTITAPGTGRAFASNASRFTTGMVSVRSLLTSATVAADSELTPAEALFYTQKSGTSMATPFVAGVIALMLDADILLTPDEIKQILMDTASNMPGYEEWQVGAGYVNAYSAVDKVFNRSKNFRNRQDATFNITREKSVGNVPFHIDFNPVFSGAGSTNSVPFTVEAGISLLDVTATVDLPAEPGATNVVGLRLHAPDGSVISPGFPIGTSPFRQVIVENPMPGTWYVEARGTRGLSTVPQFTSPTQVAAPGPVDGNIAKVNYILPPIGDIVGHSLQPSIEIALKNRLIDTYADGTFRPDSIVSREELARSLALNTSLRQSLGGTPKFSDVSGDLLGIAEAVTAKGSTMRDYDFVPTGMMSFSGTSFNPAGAVNRLDLAIALVKALGHDAAARGLANTTVTSGGVALTDNSQIPGALRGYVQVAIDKGLFEAFPAEVRQIAPGQFIVVPGPRFEPGTTVSRAVLAEKLNRYRTLFTTGG